MTCDDARYNPEERDGLFELDITRGTGVVLTILELDVLYWMWTFNDDVPMPGMMWLMKGGEESIPMAAPGAMELGTFHVGTLDSSLGYTVMWGVMMWAMMVPAMTRFVRDYANSHRGEPVAAGSVEGVITNVQTNPWDTVAGVHLVRQAGGTVTDLQGERWRHDDRGLVASNGGLHDELLAASQAIDPES